MEHILLPVRFVQFKRVGTKLKDNRLYAKIVAIAEEFTNQPLLPRNTYWFVVENPHPQQPAALFIQANNFLTNPSVQYGEASLFKIKTPQTLGNSTAIFSVGNNIRQFIMEVRNDEPQIPVIPQPQEELPVGQPEIMDYHYEANGDEPKPRINLFILIPHEQQLVNMFHNILLDLDFKQEVASSHQYLYSRRQLIDWFVLLFPYSNNRAPYLLQYLSYASEAVLWLFGAQDDNLVVIDKIMHAGRDLLRLASTNRKDLALPHRVELQLENINPGAHSTLFAIERHYQLTNQQLAFDAVRARDVQGMEQPIQAYFSNWLAQPTPTTIDVYVCFRFEKSVTTPIEQVYTNLYQAAMRVGIPVDDFNVYLVVNGSALAYVSCSSSTMWHMMLSLEKLVQELQSPNLALTSIYETTISDIDASMTREDNTPYHGELSDLKQQMIKAGVKVSAKDRLVLYSGPKESNESNQNTVNTQPPDFMKDDKDLSQGVVFKNVTRGPDTKVPPTMLALLIGINKYSYIEDLRGAVNDVKLMKKTLIEKFGFEEENIITLLGEDGADESTLPTQDNILAAFARLIELAKQNPGAVITIHYSGHGSVQPNDTKPTKQSETIVPCDSGRLKKDGGKNENDSQVPPSKDITDEQIRARLSELSKHAAHVSVIFDSCHSESVTRSPGRLLGTRAVLNDSRLGQMKLDEEKDRQHDYIPSLNNVIVIAACAYNKLAYEVEHNSEPYGALTYYWCRALQGVSKDKPVTYADIFGQIFPYFDSAKQTPKIEGERTWQLFGTSKLEGSNFALVIGQDGDDVQLDVGAVHGMKKGTVFALYKSDVRVPDGSSHTTATVVSVGSTTLWATLDQYVNTNLRGYRAFEIRRAVENMIAIHLPVNCPDIVKTKLGDRFREVTKDEAELIMHDVQPIVIQKFNVNLTLSKPALVVTDKNNNIILPVDSSDKKDVIANNLLAYALYQRHLNNHKEAPWQDQVEFVLYHSRSKRIPVHEWPEIRQSGELVEGDYIRFGVRQWSKERLYFAIIQFDENGAIEQMYPEDHGETSPLPKSEQLFEIPYGKEKSLPDNAIPRPENADDGKKGYGPLSINESIPRPADAVIKVAYKLYVTTVPTNYSYIEQEGYSVTRGAPTTSVYMTDPVEWTCKTIWCSLKHK